EADPDFARADPRIFRQEPADALQRGAELLDGRLVPQLQYRLEADPVPEREILDLDRAHLRVRHAEDRPAARSEDGRAQSDVRDRAFLASETAEVADPHGLVRGEDEAAEDVLDRLLRGKCHGRSDAAQSHWGD